MNIHLPAILMFTRGTRFWHTAICLQQSHPAKDEVPSVPCENVSELFVLKLRVQILMEHMRSVSTLASAASRYVRADCYSTVDAWQQMASLCSESVVPMNKMNKEGKELQSEFPRLYSNTT